MPRRRNEKGEGTIYQRKDKRWYAQITVGKKRPGFYGKTKAEVRAKLDEARRALERGLPLPNERQTVADYLAAWLETRILTVRPQTRNVYANDVKRICSVLGSIPLIKLTSQQVELFYASQRKELSSTTVRHLHAVLHRALQDALKHKLVLENVAACIDAPIRSHFEMQPLTEEQSHLLLQTAQGERLEAFFVLALKTGMRRGELLALRWADIDWTHRRLYVHASVKLLAPTFRAPGQPRKILDETKTDNSRRMVSLSPLTIEALRAHEHRQKVERLAAVEWRDLDLVFPGTRGDILEPEVVRLTLQSLLKRAGLPSIRVHDLRHTAITLLLAHGIDHKTVAERVGDNVVTLMTIYAHVTAHQREQVAAMIDGIFGG